MPCVASSGPPPGPKVTPARPSDVVGVPSRMIRGARGTPGASVRAGASLTAPTTTVALAVAVLNAVVPPFNVVSAVLPAVPLLRSQARKVNAGGVPFQLGAGLKRTRHWVPESSRMALVGLAAASDVQLVPPLLLYSQVPVLPA